MITIIIMTSWWLFEEFLEFWFGTVSESQIGILQFFEITLTEYNRLMGETVLYCNLMNLEYPFHHSSYVMFIYKMLVYVYISRGI